MRASPAAQAELVERQSAEATAEMIIILMIVMATVNLSPRPKAAPELST